MGSGLGLAIVREIAQRHHAGVELADGPDQRGLEVTVRPSDVALLKIDAKSLPTVKTYVPIDLG